MFIWLCLAYQLVRSIKRISQAYNMLQMLAYMDVINCNGLQPGFRGTLVFRMTEKKSSTSFVDSVMILQFEIMHLRFSQF